MASFTTKKIIIIEMKVTSSELIMINKGGYQQIKMHGDLIEGFEEVILRVQITEADQGRFDWISQEAFNHKKPIEEEEEHTKES